MRHDKKSRVTCSMAYSVMFFGIYLPLPLSLSLFLSLSVSLYLSLILVLFCSCVRVFLSLSVSILLVFHSVPVFKWPCLSCFSLFPLMIFCCFAWFVSLGGEGSVVFLAFVPIISAAPRRVKIA